MRVAGKQCLILINKYLGVTNIKKLWPPDVFHSVLNKDTYISMHNTLLCSRVLPLSSPTCGFLLLLFSIQFGKDLVSQTHSKTITTPPRRPLISPFNSPTPPPPSFPPSIHPSFHPLIATIPGLLSSHSQFNSSFPSLPTTQLCVCVLTSAFHPVFLAVTIDQV